MNKSVTFTAVLLIAASIGYGRVSYADTTTYTNPPPSESPSASLGGPAELFKQLDLTDDQKTQIGKILADAKTKLDAIKADTTLTADQKNTKVQQVRKDILASVVQILTPDQQAQLKQLVQDRTKSGPGRFFGQLDLTDFQKGQINTIVTGVKSKTDAINTDTTLTPDQKRAKLQELRKDTIKSVMDVLTPDQQVKLKSLVDKSNASGSSTGASPSKSPNP